MIKKYYLTITIALLLVLVTAFMSAPFVIGLLNTTYAEGFDDRAFTQLKPGESKEEVEQKLGQPLKINYDFGTSYLLYSEPKSNNYFIQKVVVIEGKFVKETQDGIQRLN